MQFSVMTQWLLATAGPMPARAGRIHARHLCLSRRLWVTEQCKVARSWCIVGNRRVLNVWRWREVAVWMCMREDGGVGSLQHHARCLFEFTLSAEDDDSSIVLLHGLLSDLLFRL